MIVPTGHLNFLYCHNFYDQTVEHDTLFPNSAAGLDEEKAISGDDDSCDESDTDDEAIAVMSGDDSETVNDFEDEEQNIDDLSDEEISIVWEQACNLIENRTRSRRIVRSRRHNETLTYL